MKITKQEVRKIIREQIEKEINQTTVSEDSFHHEAEHDDEDMGHLEMLRREMNRYIDDLMTQHERAEGRHEYREDY